VDDVFKEDSVVANKYKLGKILRSGHDKQIMGASRLADGARVALSLWRPEALEEAAGRRFEREARIGVRLGGRHFLRVIEVGQLEGGARYIAYEALEGQSLADILEARGPLPAQQAVDWVLQACEALAELHARGIIHRALCPASLFVAQAPGGASTLRVIDLSLAKETGPDAEDLTSDTAIMGLPLYMSPEQLRSSRNVDARTDLWALGVVLFEMLAGQPPFIAESMVDLCMAVVSEQPPPLFRFVQDLPRGLELVVLKALEKEPSDRTGTVYDLAVALGKFASAQGYASIREVARASGVVW